MSPVDRLRRRRERLAPWRPVVEGRLVGATGTALEALGCALPVGATCRIDTGADGEPSRIDAEVIGFAHGRTRLMTTSGDGAPRPGARVVPSRSRTSVPVGDALLGRVIDVDGRPLDGLGPLGRCRRAPLERTPPPPMERGAIDAPFATGVRAIDALLTLGRGQRVGLMAGSGVGKSALLGMITRNGEADVTVVALVGERGREVREFVEEALGPEGLARAVVVAVPADRPPLARLRGALCATAIAEGFRDEGRHALLLVDSVTRWAQAQREIGLAGGELPVARGYPPSVFAGLPRLLERAGALAAGGGAITAIYTVLAEGDDVQDPVVDASRAILDGHIVLDRALADAGHYPAIDVAASVSRTLPRVVDAEHAARIRRALELEAAWRRSEDLVRTGLYRAGTDEILDRAVASRHSWHQFLQQGTATGVTASDARRALAEFLDRAERAARPDPPRDRRAPPPDAARTPDAAPRPGTQRRAIAP